MHYITGQVKQSACIDCLCVIKMKSCYFYCYLVLLIRTCFLHGFNFFILL